MPFFNIVAETSDNTVVTTYQPSKRQSGSFQSEAELEEEFIRMLTSQGYAYLDIHTQEELERNLRTQLEALNSIQFTEEEWKRFFRECILDTKSGRASIETKANRVQRDYIQAFRRETGETFNIKLLDKSNVHNNSLQVIHQYKAEKENGAKHDNRYDVTILVNGLPLVHVELKRRDKPLMEAFNQIDRYQRDSFWSGSGLFEYVQIFVISNGRSTKYYSNTTRWNSIERAGREAETAHTSNSFSFTSYWADGNNRVIEDLVDFTRTFFARHTLLNILTKYCVFTSENMLLVMRPYQITATERILIRIDAAHYAKKYGTIAGGGYVWHTTGSGKTLTSFKSAQLASELPYIDKVLFVVDRKDLDYQTMKEYDRFEEGAANSNTSTAVLKRQLEDPEAKIIITTIQKLTTFIKKNRCHPIYNAHVVLIFDECHRSQFGDMHQAVVKNFKKYHLFGFTGTPITASSEPTRAPTFTTEQTFGDQLHAYTIVDAINDQNVLPFHIDYVRVTGMRPGVKEEQVFGIDRIGAMEVPERIKAITTYTLDHFAQKTRRDGPAYQYSALKNVGKLASDRSHSVREQRSKRKLHGFNSIFATASVDMAKAYYAEFKRQTAASKDASIRNLKIALIYSYGANEEIGVDGETEENPESTLGLDESSRDFLDRAIRDYNELFKTNYSTDGEAFQNYYKDVSLRMKNRELDMLIVVNMFLTGFDATTLNTLWVDKNLRMHGLIQAFSRTNRILNRVKAYGNIVCFRPLQQEVDRALSQFGDKDRTGVVVLLSFNDYFYGYNDTTGQHHPGYVDLVKELTTWFPPEERVPQNKWKDFVALFGTILRLRNLLVSYDDFKQADVLTERDLQDYSGRYQDIRDEVVRTERAELKNIVGDLQFEPELVQHIEVDVDYILMLVHRYHAENCRDKELLLSIRRAVNASPDLRSKLALIEDFVGRPVHTDDILASWREYILQRREEALTAIIEEEHLKPKETREFIEQTLRSGDFSTAGTDLSRLLPPMPRFGAGSRRSEKKRTVTERLRDFFEQFYGL